MARFPNYYQVLNIWESATEDEVRTAYKKEALRTHPDRFGSGAKKREARQKFQAVADAYWVLSHDIWRDLYAESLARERTALKRLLRKFGCGGSIDDIFADADADGIFTEVFAEVKTTCFRLHLSPTSVSIRSYYGQKLNAMLRGRVTWVPFAGNAGLGYIMADAEGASLGALIGSALDRQRGARGIVFNDLEANQRAEILRDLASQV
ncbi:DnaJ domain-containing protein [Mycena sanguinolenta]|nr:DnaJ domain-containing protein [Mycena sanguinolenta]